MLIKILIFIAVVFGASNANAQCVGTIFPKSTLDAQITSQFPDNFSGLISPSIFRAWLTGAVGSWQQGTGVNAQLGLTYTVQNDSSGLSDNGKLITFNNALSVAVTLGNPTTTGWCPFGFYTQNLGAGVVTITPPVGVTINGQASITIGQNQGFYIVSDGTNWQVFGGQGATISLQDNFYVSTTGSDTANSCTVSASPCATMQHASVEAYNFQSGNAFQTVNLSCGTYNQSLILERDNLTYGNVQSLLYVTGPHAAITAASWNSLTGVITFTTGTSLGISSGTTILLSGVAASSPGSNNLSYNNVWTTISGTSGTTIVVQGTSGSANNPGTYTSGGMMSSNCVTVNGVSPGAFVTQYTGNLVVENMTVECTAGCNTLYANGGSITYENLQFGSSNTGDQVHAEAYGSFIQGVGTNLITGGGYTHITAINEAVASEAATIVCNGTPAFSGAFAGGATMGLDYIQDTFSECSGVTGAHYLAYGETIVWTPSSTSFTYLPGNSAGVLYSGARYVGPQDITSWTTFSPTVTCGSGSISSYTAAGDYRTDQLTTFVSITLTINTIGSCSGVLTITLPTQAKFNAILPASNIATSSAVAALVGAGNSTIGQVFEYSGTAFASSDILWISGSYASTGP